MDFQPDDQHRNIQDAVRALCARFDARYWLDKDRHGGFPLDFHRAMADAGWLGVCIPQVYGGSGLGITEASILMQTIAESGAGLSGASAIHMNIFGLQPVVMFGSEEQKARFLPPLVRGEQKACFGVTEPDAGLDTTHLKTRAERVKGGYRLYGRKIWISTAQVADRILILTRTTPIEQCSKPTLGMTLFYAPLDRRHVDVREIDKMGRKCVDSNELAIDGLPVAEEDRIGEEGRGFEYILHGLNPERILIASEAVGLGRAALQRAADYARERVVFDRPIGQNQAIQHPLAESWVELEAAELLARRAAWKYDRGQPCGPDANAAKFHAAEAGFRACTRAVATHGGMGYAREYHVERYLREMMILKIAPVSPQLILSHIAEKVLGLPKSY
ncbi:acyl-CoA dehydrogenase family protein [Algiphilus sp. W345]|uniref:Acyl-CoA dehydrogenase family protein n=1 Tax=Banduia mediterranea TaxID=3075609 RepID=A0ABU2WE71_9GAMM|nr:acyl-CoA dehydrogenase family protein [Algiphilus sp. W345]MDT0496175.1 acyl-CoA dehydrogenase family protein [Algiphilus sp. W345]